MYPDGFRQDWSNPNPISARNFAIKVVALNYQNDDQQMSLCYGKFLDNGSCGYVLKLQYLIDLDKSYFRPIDYLSEPTRLFRSVHLHDYPQRLILTIISGQFFRRSSENTDDIPDPYVVVSTHWHRMWSANVSDEIHCFQWIESTLKWNIYIWYSFSSDVFSSIWCLWLRCVQSWWLSCLFLFTNEHHANSFFILFSRFENAQLESFTSDIDMYIYEQRTIIQYIERYLFMWPLKARDRIVRRVMFVDRSFSIIEMKFLGNLFQWFANRFFQNRLRNSIDWNISEHKLHLSIIRMEKIINNQLPFDQSELFHYLFEICFGKCLIIQCKSIVHFEILQLNHMENRLRRKSLVRDLPYRIESTDSVCELNSWWQSSNYWFECELILWDRNIFSLGNTSVIDMRIHLFLRIHQNQYKSNNERSLESILLDVDRVIYKRRRSFPNDLSFRWSFLKISRIALNDTVNPWEYSVENSSSLVECLHLMYRYWSENMRNSQMYKNHWRSPKIDRCSSRKINSNKYLLRREFLHQSFISWESFVEFDSLEYPWEKRIVCLHLHLTMMRRYSYSIDHRVFSIKLIVRVIRLYWESLEQT